MMETKKGQGVEEAQAAIFNIKLLGNTGFFNSLPLHIHYFQMPYCKKN
jgi:hypothetical protein